jgi:hypothetical protein
MTTHPASSAETLLLWRAMLAGSDVFAMAHTWHWLLHSCFDLATQPRNRCQC